MEQVRSNGEQKELRDEIVDLGTRYGIVTPYTSYLALEDSDSVTRIVQRQRRSREQPGGVAMLAVANAQSARAPLRRQLCRHR